MAKSADAFRTISEVAEWLGVQTHVLRFWESKFSQVKPVKRAGGRRYYRPADMLLLGGIRKLLHEDGLTIKGVQKILREEGMAHVADLSPPLDAETDAQLDADLTARIVEDVEQPPVQADVVPFSSPSKQEPQVAPATPVEAPDSDVSEPDAPLPSFLKTPEPPADSDVSAEDVSSGLPFPPMVEEVTAPTEETPAETETEQTEPAEPDLPSFMRSGPANDADAVDEPPVSDAAANTTTEEPEASGALPSFLSDYAPATPAEAEEPATVETDAAPLDAQEVPPVETDAAAPDAEEEPSAETDAAIAPAAAPDAPTTVTETPEVAAAPVPRVVDVPDDPDPDSIAVAPSALSKAARVTHLTDAQRTMIRPLLARLTALRDQMANTRREPR